MYIACGVIVSLLRRTVFLTVLPAHSAACATSNACSRIADSHYLAQYLLVIIKTNEIAVFSDSLQRHHRTAADFEATATANTNFLVNVQKIRWLPRSSTTRYCLCLNLYRFHLSFPIF